MPPLVENNNMSSSAVPAPSGCSEFMSRSKSAGDLSKLKSMSATASGIGVTVGHCSVMADEDMKKRSQSEHAAVAPSKTPSSMEWVGSYFFDPFSRNPAVVGNNNEEDLIAVRNGADGSDESTVGAHFAESDFLPSHWTGAVEYIPPVGFAVVAGGLCMLNPVVFIGGILTACTAIGAVHAAQTSYDTCIEGDLCQIFDSATKEGKTKSKATNEARDDSTVREAPSLRRELSEVTFNAAGMEDAVVEVDPGSLLAVVSPDAPIPQDPSSLETAEQALGWVNHYYPPLGYKNVDKLEFSGLNALEIFDVFLADDAPYTFSEFQKKRQDKNIQYGKWEDLTGVTQPSLVQVAATIPSQPEGKPTYHDHLKERVLHFQAKTNSGLFGPPYATTTKVQRCLAASKRLLVLEGRTSLKDIPFCDRFYVLERWLITSQKREDQYVSSMTVSCQVVFTKGCPFEETIIAKSKDTVTEIALQWNEMAQAALKKTEQARLERLKHDEKDFGTQNADKPNLKAKKSPSFSRNGMNSSIEVEHLSRSESRITQDDEPISITTGEGGKPPMGPNASKSSTRKEATSRRRSLSRTFSDIMKRRKSNPI